MDYKTITHNKVTKQTELIFKNKTINIKSKFAKMYIELNQKENTATFSDKLSRKMGLKEFGPVIVAKITGKDTYAFYRAHKSMVEKMVVAPTEIADSGNKYIIPYAPSVDDMMITLDSYNEDAKRFDVQEWKIKGIKSKLFCIGEKL